MLGQAQAIATSADNGATWAVNAAVAGATGAIVFCVCNYMSYPAVALDYTRRKGYCIVGANTVLQFDMDNPTAGFTALPALPAQGANANRITAASYGLFVTGANGTVFMPWSAMTQWLVALAPMPNEFNQNDSRPVAPLIELGDGWMISQQCNTPSPPGVKAAVRILDNYSWFDRYSMADPKLISGRKPWMKVL